LIIHGQKSQKNTISKFLVIYGSFAWGCWVFTFLGNSEKRKETWDLATDASLNQEHRPTSDKKKAGPMREDARITRIIFVFLQFPELSWVTIP